MPIFFLGYDVSEYIPCVHCASENCPSLPLKFLEILSFRRWMPRMMAAAERKGYDASEYVPCVHCG